MATESKTPTIFIVSDGRGETASQLVRAALVQFDDPRCRIILRREVRTSRVVRNVVKKASAVHGIIFYTLVSAETRQTMVEASTELQVATVDLLGPAFSAIQDLLHKPRHSTPGLLYATEREYFDRLDAVDYTLKHDDGQRPHELKHADVVLVGVSRASKSTTSFYLAYEGVRAANVPLVPGVPPPEPLLALDPEIVIGLRVNVMRLQHVRAVRTQTLRVDLSDTYLDKRTIAREVAEANRLMERQGWRSFDVSYMAVEEIAREVIRLRGLRVGA